MDQHEVTVARFRRFWQAGHSGVGGGRLGYPGGVSLGASGSVTPPTPRERESSCNWSFEPAMREDHPINCVAWHVAQAFCLWDGGRLPTEAEWELAARGPRGRSLPWGEEPRPNAACTGANPASRGGTCPVGQPDFAVGASPEGVWNLLGNVEEFTADFYVSYVNLQCWGQMARSNPVCWSPASELRGLRTVRGYAWNARVAFHMAYRRGTPPEGAAETGFRCVRPITGM
jgi:sulfatase modifying factor 1